MPYGVVTLLDNRHEQEVRDLWRQLATRFGLKELANVPHPHFSYHVATHYDLPMLEKTLTQISTQTTPFIVKTNGVALFIGAKPVVYIPVVRSPALTHLHQLVWHVSDVFASGSHMYYQPSDWMPHITLAQSDLSPEMLPDVIKFLNEQPLNWQFSVNHLAIIADGQADSQQDIRLIFSFQP